MTIKTCPKCEKTKNLESFGMRRDGRPTGICKKCAAKNTKDWREKNPERKRESQRTWEKNNPDRVRHHSLMRRYGISLEERKALGNRCYICGTKYDLHVDHDHRTGEVRGILCRRHNLGLGQFNDDPIMLLRAVDYLMGTLRDLIVLTVKERFIK